MLLKRNTSKKLIVRQSTYENQSIYFENKLINSRRNSAAIFKTHKNLHVEIAGSFI